MSAADALRTAADVDITAMSHGEDILLKAAAEQPHKIATLALLKPGPGEWRAQDWVATHIARSQASRPLPRNRWSSPGSMQLPSPRR